MARISNFPKFIKLSKVSYLMVKCCCSNEKLTKILNHKNLVKKIVILHLYRYFFHLLKGEFLIANGQIYEKRNFYKIFMILGFRQFFVRTTALINQ